ncbi:MAG: T9SS type A sorting domain-containing protein [Crocinitomicaceae bacterium]
MKAFYLSILFFSFYLEAAAQITWADHAAEVIYNNCTSCHNPNGIAPISFLTYAEVYPAAPNIQSYVMAGIMPPWTADSSFQHYSQERILTQAERDIIIDWVSGGSLPGDLNQAPPPPIYNNNQQLQGTPDLVVEAPLYMSKATNTADDYVCFAIPTGLLANKKVKAFEVIPGNLETVHHCLVYSDATASSVTDTIGGNCGGPSNGDLMGGYTPGATPVVFPATDDFASGMILEAGSNIILAMHYPEGSYGTFDQTKVNFYFYDEPTPNFREIKANPILQNWTFNIQANTVDTVEATFNGVINNFTLLSVFPHMHLVGESIESYALTPQNDTIPFIRIPHWDFEWQDFYWFEYMKKIPFGSQMYGRGIYDNTSNNVHNPNSPPQNITAGLNTSDEMFLVYFHYMIYEQGDEFINVDSLTTAFLSINTAPVHSSAELTVFPNPFTEQTVINFNLQEPQYVTIYIYDLQGKLVKKLWKGQLSQGEQSIEWNGKSEQNEMVPKGIYFYSIQIEQQNYNGRLIRR